MLNAQELSELFQRSYDGLLSSTRKLSEAEEIHMRCRLILSDEKARILIQYADDAKSLGSNEAARNAKIAELTKHEEVRVTESEAIVRGLRHNVEMHRITIDNLRYQLRCAELAAGILQERNR